MNKILSTLCISAFLLFHYSVTPAACAVKISFLEQFHTLKAAGSYREAFDAAAMYVRNVADEYEAMTALYCMNEAVRYAEQSGYAADQLKIIDETKNAALKGKRSGAVLQSLYIAQLVRSGRISEAGKAMQQSGVPRAVMLTDVYPVDGDSSFLQNISAAHYAYPRPVLSDHNGVFRMDALYDDVRNQGFDAEISFSAAQGAYILAVGCSGRIAVSVDGQSVYKDFEKKNFSSCRDFIELNLSGGIHVLKIKISGNDRNEASFRISIPGADFNTAQRHHEAEAYGKVMSYAQIGAVDSTLSVDPFIKGYLLFCAGYTGENSIFIQAFNGIADRVSFEWFLSRYYCGIDEQNSSMKEKLLRAAAEGGIAAAYEDLTRMMIDYRRYNAASEYISILASHMPRSPVLFELRAALSLSQLWFEEALMWCRALTDAGYISKGSVDAAAVYGRMGLAAEQIKMLELSYQQDRYNIRTAESLVRAGSAAAGGDAVLERCAADYPWQIHFRYAYAESLFGRNRTGALAEVTSVLRSAPEHGRALYLAGRISYAAGKKTAAEYYFSRAVKASPENRQYQEIYTVLFLSERKAFAPENPAEWERQSDPYRNEPAVCVLNEQNIQLYDDGSALTSVRHVYRIFSREHAAALATMKAAINKNTDELLELKYRFISEGSDRQSNDISSRDCSDPENSLYYDLVEYSIAAPEMRPGGFLVFEYKIHSTAGRELRGYYGNAVFFDTEFRILHASVSVASKKTVFVKPKSAAASAAQGKDADGKNVVTVTMKNLPPVRTETGMLPYADRVPSVYMTTFTDWDQFHDWFNSQLNGRDIISDEMRMEAVTLCTGALDDKEKVRRIYRMITDRIRYAGVEEGLGGYIPRSAAETWNSRKGDCKDIALLLAALLRTQNIDADIALVRTADSGTVDKGFPSLQSFNHALCRVVCGGVIYLDGTVGKYDIADLPVSDRDIEALVVAEKKCYFERIDGSLYSLSMENSTTRVNIGENGDAVCCRMLQKKGAVSIQGESDENRDRTRDISRYWNSRYPGAAINEYQYHNDNGGSSSSYTVHLKGFAETGNNEIIVPALLVPYGLKDIWGKTVRRENDIFIMDERESAASVTYVFPDGYTVADLPRDVEYAYAGINVKYRFSREKNRCSITALLTAKRSIIRRDEYQAFRDFIIGSAVIEGRYIKAEKKTGGDGK